MAHGDFDWKRNIAEAANYWFKGKSANVTQETNRFYEVGSNLSIPVINATVYSQMKLGGASKAELDQYRATALQKAVK